MALADDEFGLMNDDCDAAFADEVSLVVGTGGTFDTATGTRPKVGETNLTVAAQRSPTRTNPGNVDERMVDFRVQVSSLTQAVKPGDVIYEVDGETVWSIYAVEQEVNGLVAVLRCKTFKKPAVGG